jgi:NurA-like 5'-3' nuclease
MKIVTTVSDKNGVEITLDDKTVSSLLKEEGKTVRGTQGDLVMQTL